MMSCSMFACVQQLPEGTGVSKDAKVAFGVAARIFVSYCTATYVLPPTLFCPSALFSISTCGGVGQHGRGYFLICKALASN